VGHALTSSQLDLKKLRALLDGQAYGHTVHHLTGTTSTQDVAVDLLREGAGEGVLIVAESQTAGRGRVGRAWFSPEGTGIYMSLILNPIVPQRFAPQLTIVSAVALCRSLRRLTGLDIRMKWPNDLYVNDRKLSGILIESCAVGGRNRFILGVGISVNVPQEAFPDWLQDKATSLMAVSGAQWNREQIIAEFLTELRVMIDLYLSEGFSVFRTIWETYVWDPGRPIEMHTPEGVMKGRQQAIDEDGALMLKLVNGETMTIYAGDISLSS
jgi:BirA family biotin operon repressor/biotin-[acetyl-CoA-carboxylase] ligase